MIYLLIVSLIWSFSFVIIVSPDFSAFFSTGEVVLAGHG